MQVSSPVHHPQPTQAPAAQPAAASPSAPAAPAAAPAAQAPVVPKDEYAPSARRASSLTLPDGKPAPQPAKAAVQAVGQADAAGSGTAAQQGPEAARQPQQPAKDDDAGHHQDEHQAAEHGTGAGYAKDHYDHGGSHAMDQAGAVNTGRELGKTAYEAARAPAGERLGAILHEGGELAHGAASKVGSAVGRFVPGLNAAVALNDSRHAIEVAAKPEVPGVVKGLAAVTAGLSIVAAGNLPGVSHAAGVGAALTGTAEFVAEVMLHGGGGH